VMSIVVSYFDHLFQAAGSYPVVARLIASILVGVLAYGVALFAIGSPVIGEGIEVISWILRRRNIKV
jgi:hypothetical protein